MGGTSRVTGNRHARFCERLGVGLPGATRRRLISPRQANGITARERYYASAKNAREYAPGWGDFRNTRSGCTNQMRVRNAAYLLYRATVRP
jgi:hypothetical protein